VTDFAELRRRMVERQLAARGIRDPRVLEAMARVPREKFVPRDLAARAYDDEPLPIGHGQTISQPYVVALMIEALGLPPRARVLEVGTGSGYAAAVLAEMAEEVHSIEVHARLARKAERRLRELGYGKVAVHYANGSVGWPEGAPYHGILVSAGAPRVPPALPQQLFPGGTLVIPVGEDPHEQTLWRITRREGERFQKEDLGPVRFVPLLGRQGWSRPRPFPFGVRPDSRA
jgi:protein-L-isoaspartate(D-aspartate) O-methyltransferase